MRFTAVNEDDPAAAIRALPRRVKRGLILAACAVWLGGVAFGAWRMWLFESTPGAIGAAPRTWPTDSTIPREMQRATLMMFVHPECSCTRASVAELAKILTASNGRIGARIVVVRPDMDHSSRIESLVTPIAGVRVIDDPRGVESMRYGAATSGYTLIYDRAGQLRFAGGITSARGHEGDNMGSRSAIAWMSEESGRHATHSVYGCPLSDSDNDRAPASGGFKL